ncbi:putative RNA polymerase-associated protein Ctr9 [Septoria linicola]|nr:putative RNA polymerase-associated protein Ctr9 [Septoria linicola]
MAALTNGQSNGVNGHAASKGFERFSDVPTVIDIPVRGEDGDEAVNVDLSEALDDTGELCDLLENEGVAKNYWMTIALAYVKQKKANMAVDILKRGLEALRSGRDEDRLSLLTCMCWVYLWQCRRAPRVKSTQPTADERIKENWLALATSTLNDASRISPSYPPLFLARGTLLLLKASLQPTKFGPGGEHSDRTDTLKQASKCFDDAYRTSGNQNLLAVMGKAKAQFSMNRFDQAYILYQQVLERAPDMTDPDPRVGIGACLWQLGHKENARDAWERALELNPSSTIANILLGLYHLDQSSQYNSNDPAFAPVYRKAMTTYTQTAFKLDDMHALTCSTFGGYFLLRRTWANVERLARRAIEHTDVNAIASDGWYLLARKDHYEGDLQKAQDHYNKADQARGGDERGYLPAKFGVAQLKTLMNDLDGAKFRLEKMVSANKSVEAMTLLGILHAEDVFAKQATGLKEELADSRKKAIALLENVRIAWKDSKKKISPDSAVLLNLARLYEQEQPDKALACLQHVEQLELDEINEDDLPEDLEDEAAIAAAKREMLSPQLLNNIGCFHFQGDRLTQARENFQSALRSSVSISNKDESVDTDALVSTISYNLGRVYEAEGIEDEAEKIYKSLLDRHPDYIDANTRMAYIALRADPAKGAEAIKQLLDADPGNLQVRALYGWHLNRTKKRTLALNEDQEQRHYKHTLMTYDKHDIYSLTGMGNLNLVVAREMPRDTDQHKDRRSKTYHRAIEFFDKVLTLDPKNAFAAQGVGIGMIEERKDTTAAIQIFSKVRESVKDASVHINLGHVFCELKQFSRSIENYELALVKSREKDPHIMACLGRVWLMRGRAEKNLEYYKMSLDYSQQALQQSPENISFRFNVAFVQIQIAQQMISQPEANKTLVDVEAANKGLDEAIESFIEIAKGPNPPFPRHDIEQRANMGRNTMKRQLATATEKQAEYERKNATRLEEARKRREEEIRKREEEKRVAQEKADEEKRKLREERERIQEEDRLLIEKRLNDERIAEEAQYTTDEDGVRKKREKKPKEKRQKRKKKGEDSDTDAEIAADGTGDEGGRSRHRSRATSATGSDGEAPRKKKKRRLERKGQAVKSNSKYKSAETIQDSDEDDDAGLAAPGSTQPRSEDADTPGAGGEDDTMAEGGDEDEEPASRQTQRRKPARVLDDDDDEDEDAPMGNGDVAAAGDSDHGHD